MLFNSVQFLIFFPVVCLIYYAIPKKIRWVWLLLASYYFYMCWNPKYALLMLTSTVITWLSGVFIDRFGRIENEQKSKRLKNVLRHFRYLSCISGGGCLRLRKCEI